MQHTIDGLTCRPITDDEWSAYFQIIEPTFGQWATENESYFWRALTQLDRTLAVFDGEKIVASCLAHPLELTVPGGSVRMAGLTFGQVLPSYRRRGLLGVMLQTLEAQAKDRAEAIVGGWPSESGIHWKFGWGPATWSSLVTLGKQHVKLRRPTDHRGQVSIVEPEEAIRLAEPIYEQARAHIPGMVSRDQVRWKDWTKRDPWHWQGPEWQTEVGPRTFAVYEGNGYVAYRLQRRWDIGGPSYRVLIAELVATDPRAYRALWQWCLELDLAAVGVATQRPVDEPLRLMLANPRRLSVQTADALWIKLVDVVTAMTARTYGQDGTIVMEVMDEFDGSTTGRYRLVVEDGRASCVRTNDLPHVAMGIDALSSLYLGGLPVRVLAAAGMVEEQRSGQLQALQVMLQSPVTPWCPWVF